MDILTLRTLFMWCTIINGGLFGFWVIVYKCAPDLLYRTQRIWFPLSKEMFTIVMYSYLGLFKIFFLMFNLVPYIALLIVA